MAGDQLRWRDTVHEGWTAFARFTRAARTVSVAGESTSWIRAEVAEMMIQQRAPGRPGRSLFEFSRETGVGIAVKPAVSGGGYSRLTPDRGDVTRAPIQLCSPISSPCPPIGLIDTSCPRVDGFSLRIISRSGLRAGIQLGSVPDERGGRALWVNRAMLVPRRSWPGSAAERSPASWSRGHRR